MPTSSPTKPVEDTVPKVDNEVAVGSDLKFQRRWWRFEKAVWTFFTILLILTAAGVFGRGPLAKAKKSAPDGSINVTYERVERYGTPSILTVRFGPNTVTSDKVQLWVSESLVKTLGTQRVIPQPMATVVSNGGLLYTFSSSTTPGSVEFALQPGKVGSTGVQLQLPGHQKFQANVFVMP